MLLWHLIIRRKKLFFSILGRHRFCTWVWNTIFIKILQYCMQLFERWISCSKERSFTNYVNIIFIKRTMSLFSLSLSGQCLLQTKSRLDKWDCLEGICTMKDLVSVLWRISYMQGEILFLIQCFFWTAGILKGSLSEFELSSSQHVSCTNRIKPFSGEIHLFIPCVKGRQTNPLIHTAI